MLLRFGGFFLEFLLNQTRISSCVCLNRCQYLGCLQGANYMYLLNRVVAGLKAAAAAAAAGSAAYMPAILQSAADARAHDWRCHGRWMRGKDTTTSSNPRCWRRPRLDRWRWRVLDLTLHVPPAASILLLTQSVDRLQFTSRNMLNGAQEHMTRLSI